MVECTSYSGGSSCEIGSGQALDNDEFCRFGNVIYKSASSDCSAEYGSAGTTEGDYLFKDGTHGMVAGTMGTDVGLIYTCTTTSGCTQKIDTYYYHTKLYKCDDNGNCTLDTSSVTLCIDDNTKEGTEKGGASCGNGTTENNCSSGDCSPSSSVTEMVECTSYSGGSSCEIGSGQALDNDEFCRFGNVIYKSASSDCSAEYGSAGTTEGDYLFKDGTHGMVAGTMGTDVGLIYTCTTTSGCTQKIDTYYYHTKLYKFGYNE
ncbi:hypothetical protein U3516DRAFT_857096 [Neocallimastix sp. 'constans']